MFIPDHMCIFSTAFCTVWSGLLLLTHSSINYMEFVPVVPLSTVEHVLKDHPMAIEMVSLKAGGLCLQVQLHWNVTCVRPARNVWSFKTDAVVSQSTKQSVAHYLQVSFISDGTSTVLTIYVIYIVYLCTYTYMYTCLLVYTLVTSLLSENYPLDLIFGILTIFSLILLQEGQTLPCKSGSASSLWLISSLISCGASILGQKVGFVLETIQEKHVYACLLVNFTTNKSVFSLAFGSLDPKFNMVVPLLLQPFILRPPWL